MILVHINACQYMYVQLTKPNNENWEVSVAKRGTTLKCQTGFFFFWTLRSNNFDIPYSEQVCYVIWSKDYSIVAEEESTNGETAALRSLILFKIPLTVIALVTDVIFTFEKVLHLLLIHIAPKSMYLIPSLVPRRAWEWGYIIPIQWFIMSVYIYNL